MREQRFVVPEANSFDLLTNGIDFPIRSQVLIVADACACLEACILIQIRLQVKDKTGRACDGNDVPAAKVGDVIELAAADVVERCVVDALRARLVGDGDEVEFVLVQISEILIDLTHLCSCGPFGLVMVVTVDKGDRGELGVLRLLRRLLGRLLCRGRFGCRGLLLLDRRSLLLGTSGKQADEQKRCQKKCKNLFHSTLHLVLNLSAMAFAG